MSFKPLKWKSEEIFKKGFFTATISPSAELFQYGLLETIVSLPNTTIVLSVRIVVCKVVPKLLEEKAL